MNTFLFIIPLTPKHLLSTNRQIIQNNCFLHLNSQNYKNWQALVIGNELPETIENNKNFIHVKYEGIKEEKLQIATKYIIENRISADYIIRLDDDDYFNPRLLKQLETDSFDVYTDKYHAFYEFETGLISQQIRLWLPNTCIHKFEHAMAGYGNLANARIKRLNEEVRLIENDHSKIHRYYSDKKVVYAKKNDPVYLRVLNKESITAKAGSSYRHYLKQFGYWEKHKMKSFLIPEQGTAKKSLPEIDYSVKEKVYNLLHQATLNLFYNHLLFKKH